MASTSHSSDQPRTGLPDMQPTAHVAKKQKMDESSASDDVPTNIVQKLDKHFQIIFPDDDDEDDLIWGHWARFARWAYDVSVSSSDIRKNCGNIQWKELSTEVRDLWQSQDKEKRKQAWGLIKETLRALNPQSQVEVLDYMPSKTETESGWNSQYVGDWDKSAWQSVRHMHALKVENAMRGTRPYSNHVAFIQSSGSGKSRMVREMMRFVFTISINVRDPEAERQGGVFPPCDESIGKAFRDASELLSESARVDRYIWIFGRIFDGVGQRLDGMDVGEGEDGTDTDEEMGRTSLSRLWKKKLESLVTDSSKTTFGQAMYDDIFKKVNDHRSPDLSSDQARGPVLPNSEVLESSKSSPSDNKKETATKLSLRWLLGLLETVKKKQGTRNVRNEGPTILFAIDEVQDIVSNSTGFPEAVQELYKAMETFEDHSIFFIVLSTQPDVFRPAPRFGARSSDRYRPSSKLLHGPFTEMPFDCLEGAHMSNLELYMTYDPVYMSLYGRPLWQSLFTTETTKVLEYLTSCTNDSESDKLRAARSAFPVIETAGTSELRPTRNTYQCGIDLFKFARHMLLSPPRGSHIDSGREVFEDGQFAVLSCRLLPLFERGRESVVERQIKWVSSHLATLWSAPQQRRFQVSGWAPEPVLAEAAAQQLHIWSQGRDPLKDSHSSFLILDQVLASDLLDRDESSYMVARQLLTRARDEAVLEDWGKTNEGANEAGMRFSKPVALTDFLEKLFAKDIAHQFLESVPEHGNEQPIRDVFSKSVVNFTHFSKYDDQKPEMDCRVLLLSFARQLAIICNGSKPYIDLIIPVLVNKDLDCPLRPSNMTAIYVQVMRGTEAGKIAIKGITREYVEELWTPAGTGSSKYANNPYIALAMELGAAQEDRRYEIVPRAQRERSRRSQSMSQGFGLTVYGCGGDVYEAIQCEEEERILQRGLWIGSLNSLHAMSGKNNYSHLARRMPFIAADVLCLPCSGLGPGNAGNEKLEALYTRDIDRGGDNLE